MIGPFGYWGLALGTSIGAIFNACLLLGSVRRVIMEKGGGFPVLPLVLAFFQQLAVAIAMGGACFLTYRLMDQWIPDRILLAAMGNLGLALSRAVKVVLVVLEGAILVVFFAKILRLKDTTEAFDIFYKKLKNKLSRGAT